MKLDNNTTNSKTINRFKTLENDFHKKHNYKYNYDKFIFSGSHDKSIIICLTHGEFEQNPTNHLQGKGCDCQVQPKNAPICSAKMHHLVTPIY